MIVNILKLNTKQASACFAFNAFYKMAMDQIILPTRGLSDVMGMIAETVLRKMVKDRRMVTPRLK